MYIHVFKTSRRLLPTDLLHFITEHKQRRMSVRCFVLNVNQSRRFMSYSFKRTCCLVAQWPLTTPEWPRRSVSRGLCLSTVRDLTAVSTAIPIISNNCLAIVGVPWQFTDNPPPPWTQARRNCPKYQCTWYSSGDNVTRGDFRSTDQVKQFTHTRTHTQRETKRQRGSQTDGFCSFSFNLPSIIHSINRRVNVSQN